MADINYLVLLTIATRGRTDSDITDLVQRARLQAGAREPVIGGMRGTQVDDDGPEPATIASFNMVAPDADALEQILTIMVDWLETREQVTLLSPPRIASKREVPPMDIDARGLQYDAATGVLTVQPEAGFVELQLVHPHETEPGILVIVTTEGFGRGRFEHALLVERVVFGTPPVP